MEAENFRTLTGYELGAGGNGVSQRTYVRLAGTMAGRLSTPFNELYTTSGTYEVAVRYPDDSSSSDATFTVRIDDAQVGSSWSGTSHDDAWHTESFQDVVLHLGDTLDVVSDGASGGLAQIDSIELSLQSAL